MISDNSHRNNFCGKNKYQIKNIERRYILRRNMIYASTNCLKNPKNVEKVLEEYKKSGIENVELGSVHAHFETKILKQFDFNFLVHNYKCSWFIFIRNNSLYSRISSYINVNE